MKIADLQDRRLTDSLYPYFNHENALYRRDAVHAFGSLRDSTAVEKIGTLLLGDEDPSVKIAAAFALGQIQRPSCEPILLEALEQKNSADVTFEILQAYGKTTSEWRLEPSRFLNDSFTTSGMAWSIYRAGLRGKAQAGANDAAAGLLNNQYSHNTRLGAAHFFARGARNFGSAEKPLISSARDDVSPEVRMAAALSLGKIRSDSALAALKQIIKSDEDARVVANAVKALGSFPYDQVRNYLYEALNHKDVNVGIAASELIIGMVRPDDWIEVSSLTNRVTHWRIQANLYEAALKAGRNPALAQEIKDKYATATNPYQKAAFMSSLKHFPETCQFVHTELLKADTAVVRSSAAGTLVAMSQSEHFDATLRPRFAKIYRELMESQEDPAVLGTIASALADSTQSDPSPGFRDILRDPAFLYNAKRKLRLPEHNESLQSIEAAIAYFENREGSTTVKNEFNHPIDWSLVKRIPEGQLATIRTSRGKIVIRLMVNESPGSVANFVALAQKNYFDNKVIHRVVPNFVIQDGCKRGDGWGSEDYSLRSELSTRRYRTGSVGMASAGKDTEGTQWFITHSPTPHLDGRYTIFAEVTEGQRVVDFLQVGDKILDVSVENFPAQ